MIKLCFFLTTFVIPVIISGNSGLLTSVGKLLEQTTQSNPHAIVSKINFIANQLSDEIGRNINGVKNIITIETGASNNNNSMSTSANIRTGDLNLDKVFIHKVTQANTNNNDFIEERISSAIKEWNRSTVPWQTSTPGHTVPSQPTPEHTVPLPSTPVHTVPLQSLISGHTVPLQSASVPLQSKGHTISPTTMLTILSQLPRLEHMSTMDTSTTQKWRTKNISSPKLLITMPTTIKVTKTPKPKVQNVFASHVSAAESTKTDESTRFVSLTTFTSVTMGVQYLTVLSRNSTKNGTVSAEFNNTFVETSKPSKTKNTTWETSSLPELNITTKETNKTSIESERQYDIRNTTVETTGSNETRHSTVETKGLPLIYFDDFDHEDSFWPLAIALAVGIPSIVVLAVTVTVLYRNRLTKPRSILSMYDDQE